MKKSLIHRIFQQEDINFWLTNRIPRRLLTIFMGWFSQIENPLIAKSAIAIWRWFADDLQLEEARQSSFKSLHECFIRELKEGTRPIDPKPTVVVSPCDAIVGAMGSIRETELIQAKGFPYTLEDLLGNQELVERYRNGRYVTLRLKSSMYHRFHAPCDCRVQKVYYISGDVWNVNPITLRRVQRLFCKNERAVIPLIMPNFGQTITLVPIAAILVASIHLNFLDVLLNLRYWGPNPITCDASFKKGDEMGYFHHGSTIIVFAAGQFEPCASIQPGNVVRMGQPLMESVTLAGH
jgi:phosphatidylserine decarboxylase